MLIVIMEHVMPVYGSMKHWNSAGKSRVKLEYRYHFTFLNYGVDIQVLTNVLCVIAQYKMIFSIHTKKCESGKVPPVSAMNG